jgi:ABC-type Mn2+/Zn2+ transport system ATPase subunit
MTDVLFQMLGVTVGHGTTAVVRQVEWTVRRGDAWCLIGSNGTGKSTLLATALGRLPSLAGQVTRRSGLLAGSIPQDCGVVSDLPVTVRELVGMGLTSGSAKSRRAAVDAAMSECQLTPLASRQVWRLSGGERRRAMIARALAQGPELLALDEPSAGLDVAAEEDLVAILRRLSANGVTLICITHHRALVAALATQVAEVDGGRLREVPVAHLHAHHPLTPIVEVAPG